MKTPFNYLIFRYRQHPALSCLPNHLFYADQLKDGVTADQRQAYLSTLQPLCCVDIRGHEQKSVYQNMRCFAWCVFVSFRPQIYFFMRVYCLVQNSGSYYNVAEVEIVCQIVRSLLQAGVRDSDIGVIALCMLVSCTLQCTSKAKTCTT